MVTVRQVAANETALIPQLGALLQDAVDNGAPLGFLAPLRPETATRYWDGVFAAIGGDRIVWVAESDDRVVGTVQLELCAKESGRHRAEVQKLAVLQSHRGRGISSLLMAAAEKFAAAQDRTLLILNAPEGSKAEAIYRHRGWQVAGRIPGYAVGYDGMLVATMYLYKNMDAA
jgi:GNAT superfamily N-acetyltransferase